MIIAYTVLLTIGISVFSWLWASLIIFALQYGHILGNIKWKWANKIVYGLKEPDELGSILTHSDVVEEMNKQYDMVSRYDKTFALFDCRYCLSVRIALVLSVVVVLPLMVLVCPIYGFALLFTLPITYKLNDI